MITPVILAGGSGTRLWPLSRSKHPKQFLAFNGDATMLQRTVERLSDLPTDDPITVCSEEHRFLAAEQLRQLNCLGKIVLEPSGKNTAPAIALAALSKQDQDPILLVLPADHLISDQTAFAETVLNALPLAEEGKLVMFGVIPNQPHTGYGYIRASAPYRNAYSVDSFKEKPDVEKARSYIKDGSYYWNSGMFLFKASRYLRELERYRPDIFTACKVATQGATCDREFVRLDSEAFMACPSDSIDYAVMERTSDAVVVPMDAGWNDIGSWSSLWEVSPKDGAGNVTSGDVMLHKSKRCFAKADDKFVAMVGVEDLIVVTTHDAILVSHKDAVQDAKIIAGILKEQGRPEWEVHTEVYRPWGKFCSVDQGAGYQVKRIMVNPGQKLSVQMHHYRAEHWVVVSGTAKVTKGDEEFLLSENESTYIPIGEIHSLENPAEVVLEIIEIQSGTYLGEDDIVRFSDRYGRVVDSN